MPAGNGYSIGQDSSVVIIDSAGGRLDFSIVTDFDSKENSKTINVEPMSGPMLTDEIPRGWEGSFGLDRGSTKLDDYFATRAATFFATNRLPTAQLFHYLSEADGTTSTWLYSAVTFKLSEAGKWAGADQVKQKVAFMASTKVRVS